MGRIVAIKHRVKKTAAGEARPTLVAIETDGKIHEYRLGTEEDELDFVFGKWPVEYRQAQSDEELSQFLGRQIVRRQDKKTGEIVETKVPSRYEGLQPGDTAVTHLGGSGDYLCYALARRAATIGAQVLRCRPHDLKERRGEEKKENDHLLALRLFQEEPQLFRPVSQRDLEIIYVRILFKQRQDAVKARVTCEQRLFQRTLGRVFSGAETAPEQSLRESYLCAKANDAILNALLKEESGRDAELAKAIQVLPVWQKIFEEITGVGPRLAAGLITNVGDIRLYKTVGGFKRFCGVALSSEGEFMRRKAGERDRWNSEVRKTLFLLADQFNRRPDSEWGQKLLAYKAKFRERHPEAVKVNGRLRYTAGDIQQMARWRTLTKFCERLYREWTKLASGWEREIEAKAR